MLTESFFVPGSKWLYYKIYCGPGYANTILVKNVSPFIQQLLKEENISKWFFIRYYDPDHHLRLRLYCPNTEVVPKVIMAFEEQMRNLVSLGYISDIQIGTYKRELSRYGQKNIEPIEEFWSKESTLILTCLKKITQQEDYLCGIFILVHNYLKVFSSDDTQLLEYANTHYHAFVREFGLQKHEKKRLSEKYRGFQPKLNHLFTSNSSDFIPSESFKAHVSELKKCHTHLCLKETPNLWSSMVHMLVNRAFENSQREMEMVIYHHLSTYYKSQLSRFGKI